MDHRTWPPWPASFFIIHSEGTILPRVDGQSLSPGNALPGEQRLLSLSPFFPEIQVPDHSEKLLFAAAPAVSDGEALEMQQIY